MSIKLLEGTGYRYDPVYRFYGWEHAGDITPVKECGCETLGDFYLRLLKAWSRETCSEKFRHLWSEANPTAGQCTITAALVCEFFGGDIMKLPLTEGGFHSFNKIGGVIIDLACEQFGKDALLDFENALLGDAGDLLASPEKAARFDLLRRRFLEV